MDFVVTPEFLVSYEALAEDRSDCIDQAITRLLTAPESAWARSGRVMGDAGAAWLVEVPCDDDTFVLYWNHQDSSTIVLLLLIAR